MITNLVDVKIADADLGYLPNIAWVTVTSSPVKSREVHFYNHGRRILLTIRHQITNKLCDFARTGHAYCGRCIFRGNFFREPFKMLRRHEREICSDPSRITQQGANPGFSLPD